MEKMTDCHSERRGCEKQSVSQTRWRVDLLCQFLASPLASLPFYFVYLYPAFAPWFPSSTF